MNHKHLMEVMLILVLQKITIAAEDDQTPGALIEEKANESSAGANKKTIIRVEGIM